MTDDKIKISWDDIRDPNVDKELARQQVRVPPPGAGPPPPAGVEQPPGPRDYGRVSPLPAPVMQGGIKYSPVFYTALAGLVAAIAAWLLTEYVVQNVLGPTAKVSSIVQAALFFAVVGAILGAGLCSVEGLVSRNLSNAVASGAVGFCLGLAGGAVAGGAGQALYAMGSAERQWVVMALDTSGSMEGEPLFELKSSSQRFVAASDTKASSIGVVTFDRKVQVVSGLSSEPGPILRAISNFTASGETNMAEGIKQARLLLEGCQGRRAILLFTDGVPTLTAGMDLATLAQDELRRRNMTEMDIVTQELGRRGLTLADLADVPEDTLEKVVQAAFLKFLDESGVLKKMSEAAEAATLEEAGAARRSGIEIIAIGTGEADRSFLARVTGRPDAVLFAASGEIAKAFERAQKLIFKESGGATGAITAAGVMMRAFGWAFVGALLALGQGIVSRSAKKMRNATIGGFLGGLLGGVLFDPISAGLGAGWASRFVAIAVIGTATGALIGLVENLLKDAWLRVVAGRLTGKQFVIYRNPTMIGSSPKSDIYLFKDAAVEPQHAAISNDGHAYFIQDYGTPAGTLVNGRRVTNQRLRSGDTIQVGATQFQYSEKTAKL